MPETLTPETLRMLLREFEVLRGKVLARGDIEKGTDSSVSVGVLLDDGYAHASAWEADIQKRQELQGQVDQVEAAQAEISKAWEADRKALHMVWEDLDNAHERIEALERIAKVAEKHYDHHKYCDDCACYQFVAEYKDALLGEVKYEQPWKYTA